MDTETASGLLNVYEGLPAGLLERDARRLHERLPGPSLIHLPGRREPPLFVSVLLHGNEDTGWEAVRRVLLRYRGMELPRALSIFIGNVRAAERGVRHLPGQPDFNRIWRGGTRPEHQLAQQVLAAMRERGLFASVDVHNNTGMNPHYGCINRLEDRYLHLAALFSRTVVYFIRPEEVQSMAFAELCPAVTVECGQPGHEHSEAHAADYLEACLQLAEIPDHPVAAGDLDLFHTVAVVKVPESRSVALGSPGADLSLLPDIDRLNFNELPAGTPLGTVSGSTLPLEVRNEAGEDVGAEYFAVEDGELRITRPAMPSMLTRDIDVIRSDCLCYLMERLDPDRHGGLS